jgi:hypothetical protein
MPYEQISSPSHVLHFDTESSALRAAIEWLYDFPYGRIMVESEGRCWTLRRWRRVLSPDVDVRMVREPVVAAQACVDCGTSWLADDGG